MDQEIHFTGCHVLHVQCVHFEPNQMAKMSATLTTRASFTSRTAQDTIYSHFNVVHL